MQRRHLDRKAYFKELANTSRDFYLPYLSNLYKIETSMNILEVGCGEGGNLVPFAKLGCKVTGIDIAECRINDAKAYFQKSAIMQNLYAVIS